MAKKKKKELADLTRVRLSSESAKRNEPFSRDHAERILKLSHEKGGDWQIVDTEKFQFDIENGLRDKSNTGDSKESEKPEGNQ